MRQLFILFCLCCCLCTVGHAQDDAVASFNGFHDGKQFDFTVTSAHLANSPEWLGEQDNPPLAARRALTIASDYLPKLVTNAEKWEARAIRLCPVRDRWVYAVEFSERREGVQAGFVIVVLMNGEVVEPKITKQKMS
jgi:hypothetical protein